MCCCNPLIAPINPFAPSFPAEFNAGNKAGASAIDVSQNLTQRITLTGNANLTINGLVAGRAQWWQLKVIQGGAGNFTLAIVGARTPAGSGLTLTKAVGSTDIVSGYWDGALNFATVAGLAFA